MTIQMDTVYNAIIDNCEERIIDCIREGKETFVITFPQFHSWLTRDTDCCEITSRDKWKNLNSKGVIQTFGQKNKSAHVIVDELLTISGFYEKYKNKKIKIFQAELKGVKIDG